MISILSVNYNCIDWMKLLVNSIRKFTTIPHEIIIVDNASEDGSREWLKTQEDIKTIFMIKNIGHGRGLDLAIGNVINKFCLVMDIDAHLQRREWDYDFIKLYSSNPKIRLVAAKGGNPEWVNGNPRPKPIHACFQFFKTEFFIDNKLNFAPKNGYDVGRKNYYDVTELGYEVLRISAGYEKDKKKFYDGAWGCEYYINGKPTIYHNWYSARMWKRDKVDNLDRKEFQRRANKVFEHPLVKDILNHNYKQYQEKMRELKGLPWFEKEAIEFLDKVVKKDHSVLEIGSGSSTSWFAKRANYVLSFEHDDVWLKVVKDELALNNIENATLRFEPNYPEKGLPELKETFDVILIDGPTEGRNAHIETGIKHIRPGGYFILDDSQRESLYVEGLKLLDSQGWEKWDFNNPGHHRHTSIWKANK